LSSFSVVVVAFGGDVGSGDGEGAVGCEVDGPAAFVDEVVVP
jgi:hypothetical protein